MEVKTRKMQLVPLCPRLVVVLNRMKKMALALRLLLPMASSSK